MYKTKVEFNTNAGVIPAGKILNEKELKNYFSEEEIEKYKKDKYLLVIKVPDIVIDNSPSQKEKKGVEIKNINEMNDEEILEYAAELGISKDDADDAYNAIVEFDYKPLKAGPLKKYAQIIGANLENATKKDEYIEAINELLEGSKEPLPSGDKNSNESDV